MKGFRPTGNGPKAGHSFGASHGFTASAGGHVVKSHMRAAPKRNPPAQQGAKLQALAGLLAATQGGAGGPPPGGPPGMAGPPPGMAGPQVPGAPMGGPSQVPGAGMAKGGKWIAGATKNKGALHRALGVPQGEKIPAKKLVKAEHSSSPLMRKRASLAKTLSSFHAKGGRAGHGADCGCKMCSGGMAYAKGGSVKTGNYVGSNIPQDAPRGKPEFQDFRKGGRAKRVKKSAGGIIINRPR